MIRFALVTLVTLLSFAPAQTVQSVKSDASATAPLPPGGGKKDIPPGDTVQTRDGKQSVQNNGTGTGKITVRYSGVAVRSETAPNTWIVEVITEVDINSTDAVCDDIPNVNAPKSGSNITVTGTGTTVTVTGDNVTVTAASTGTTVHCGTSAQNTTVNAGPGSSGNVVYSGGGFSGSINYAPGAGAWGLRRA